MQISFLYKWTRKLVCENGGEILDAALWIALTREEYTTWRGKTLHEMNVTNPIPPPPSPTGMTNTTQTSAASTSTDVQLFKKSIRRDPSLFAALKDDRMWESWNLTFVAQANSQGLHNILDPEYTPTTNEDRELFKHQQEYMFSVTKVLQTDTGKNSCSSICADLQCPTNICDTSRA